MDPELVSEKNLFVVVVAVYQYAFAASCSLVYRCGADPQGDARDSVAFSLACSRELGYHARGFHVFVCVAYGDLMRCAASGHELEEDVLGVLGASHYDLLEKVGRRIHEHVLDGISQGCEDVVLEDRVAGILCHLGEVIYETQLAADETVLHVISVIKRVYARKDLLHRRVDGLSREPADVDKAVADFVLLIGECCLIGKVCKVCAGDEVAVS